MAKKTAPKATSGLIAALKYVAPVKAEFCTVFNNWLIASNEFLSAAFPIEEDLNACPNSSMLLDALNKCGEDLAITQLSQMQLAVKSGEFKALIPCGQDVSIDNAVPDPICASINDNIKAAFDSILPLIIDSAKIAYHASLLLQANTAVSTNGAALLEYWHGIDLPPGMLIPRACAVAVAKCPHALKGFGFSANTATFHFENGAFYKTRLFAEKFPSYAQFFDNELPAMPIPQEFFKAVEAIALFSQEGKVYFDDGYVSSRETINDASTYRLEGLPTSMGFNAKFLIRVKHAMQTAAFNPAKGEVVFYGPNVRGILRGLNLTAKDENLYKLAKSKLERQSQIPNIEPDDIPF